jgi:retron-type reverse transcriptase
VKRVYIPKAGSSAEKRPIGIPTYEDKILQRAIAMALEPILEREFYDFSYGFRPGKSAHQALNRVWKESMNGGLRHRHGHQQILRHDRPQVFEGDAQSAG